MRIFWSKVVAQVLVVIAAAFVGTAIIVLAFTPYQRLASLLNIAGCILILCHSLYKMRYDPAHRNGSPFDRNDFRLF